MDDRIKQLEAEVQHAYHTLGEVTTRLLLANDAAEAILATEDREELSRRFLALVARATEVRRSALFIHDGHSLTLGASSGLSAEEEEAMTESGEIAAHCERALKQGSPLVLDPELVPELPEPLEAEEEEEEEAGQEGDEEAGEEEEQGASGSAPEFGVYLPARLDREPVAVLALGERARGQPYSADDLGFLGHLLGQLAVALNRSVLKDKSHERLQELDALLRISRELTSTLDLEAVLRGVVNTTAAVVENDRCQLLLFEGGKLRIRAVSGLTRIPADQLETSGLAEVVDWLRLTSERVQVGAEEIAEGKPVPGREVFERYFASGQMHAFMAIPLKDDQGLLGFLCLESRQDSWALDPSEGDALDILGAQTTIALRNALLYGQIPMRGMAVPALKARARWGRLSLGRRRLLAAAAGLALLLLALPVVPDRASGPCEVLPARSYTIRAETDGVVRQVQARGGEAVAAGQVLAVMEDPDLAARLSELRGRLGAARVEASMAQQRGNLLEYRVKQLEAQDLADRVAFEEGRARRAILTAPAAGHVLDLNLAEQQGRYLEAGDPFCRVSDLGRMRAEVRVDENHIGRLELGDPVQLKVVAYPTRSFRGRVAEVAWRAEKPTGALRTFTVRVEIPNPDLALRPGMTGQAKVTVGRRSALGLLAEPFVRWAQLSWW